MWQQDDWNSCEDLTLCYTHSPACDLNFDGETGPRQPYRESSYPVGCAPAKTMKENEASDRGKSKLKDQPRRRFADCIKHKRRAWMKAVGRFLRSVRHARATESAPKQSSKRPGEQLTSNSNFSSQPSCRGTEVSWRGKPSQAPALANQEQLWSFTHAIRKRLSRPVSSSHLKRPRVKDEGHSRKLSPSESFSTSTKSSTSLSFNRPEDPEGENVGANQDFISPLSLPRLDTLFDPFLFEPSELIEELR